jgi:hypothetical protein
VKLEAAVLCDFAEVRDNLLFVVAGGITRLWRPEFPGPMGVDLALMVSIEPAERAAPHELRVDLVDPAGATMIEMRVGLQIGGTFADPGEVTYLPVALDFRNVIVTGPGWHTISIRFDDGPAAELRIKAEQRDGPGQVPPAAGLQTPPGARGDRPN